VTIIESFTCTGGASYSLSSASGTFTGLTPSTLPSGLDTIKGTFIGNVGVSGNVTFVLTIVCGSTVCQDTFVATLPNCTKMLAANIDPDSAVAATEEIKMLLMPNPATELVNLLYNAGSEHGILSLALVDMEGKEIEEQILPTTAGTATINVSGLAAGIYYVTLRRDHRALLTDKLVVMSR
jgi:hypothetical protein